MPVLGTKPHPPRPRRRLVQRLRLTDQLSWDGGEAPRLVLVAAPAGFGMTTLLAQWLADAESRAAWLALDPGDADLRLFLTHLATAIQIVEPEAGTEALALLEPGASTQLDAVLVSLIDDLDVLAGPTVVALDGYHVIDGSAVHEAVTFFLDNLPPQVTLSLREGTRGLRNRTRMTVRTCKQPRSAGAPAADRLSPRALTYSERMGKLRSLSNWRCT